MSSEPKNDLPATFDAGKKSQIVQFFTSQRESFPLAVAGDDGAWKAFAYRFAETMLLTPALKNANVSSQVMVARRIAETGLWPIPGGRSVYITPYKGGKNSPDNTCTFTIGPGGWTELLYRAGAARVISATVHEGDAFDPGSLIPPMPPRLVPSADPQRSTRPYTFAAAYVEWKDGTPPDFRVADLAYLNRVKRASPAQDGPWSTWAEGMAQAKVLKLLARDVCLRPSIDSALRTQILAADAQDAEVIDVTANETPEKPTEPPPVTTRARGSRANKTDAAPAGEAPPTSPAAPSGPSSDTASASAGPAGDPAPETLESLVDKALKARPTEAAAKAEWEAAHNCSLHPVSIKRAIGGPFATEAEAVEALVRFIG